MKTIVFLLTIVIAITASSQKCDGFYYLQKNKTVEMTTTNKKGKLATRVVYKISDVKKSGTGASSSVSSELFDAKGKTIASAAYTVKCTGGVMLLDMAMFIPATQQQQMGTVAADAASYIEYPADMKEGDVLKDGHFSMDFKMQSGIGASVTVEITDRQVTGKESVTTPAGSWECFKISYNSKIIMKIGVGIPIKAKVTEWYAPGFGVVKSESGGSITQITVLN
jgi:hypothetical protein